MKDSSLTRCALSISVAAALLASCGGSQPPIGAPGAMPQTFSHAAHADRGTSWMLPEAKGEDLLYASIVINASSPAVYVFAYPEGDQIGELTDFASGYYPQGLCTDKSGDVFVTTLEPKNTSESYVYEYAHGGTEPVATLSDPGVGQGCAIDPTSGNLAVANAFTASYGNGDIAVYRKARGTPALFSDSNIESFFFCTYDNGGNLFSSGTSQSYTSNLFELPEGSSNFKDVSLTKSFAVGSVQWTTGALAAAEQNTSHKGEQAVFQVQISGSTGTVSGPTLLWSRRNQKTRDLVQFWVQDGMIIGPDYWGGVGLWRYPEGGRPTKAIGASYGFYGVTISAGHKV